MIRSRHEGWAGQLPGPAGWRAIPSGTRVVGSADVYDALTRRSPQSHSQDDALEIILKDAQRVLD